MEFFYITGTWPNSIGLLEFHLVYLFSIERDREGNEKVKNTIDLNEANFFDNHHAHIFTK